MSQPRPAASASTNVFLVQFLNLGNQEKSQITREKKFLMTVRNKKVNKLQLKSKSKIFDKFKVRYFIFILDNLHFYHF